VLYDLKDDDGDHVGYMAFGPFIIRRFYKKRWVCADQREVDLAPLWLADCLPRLAKRFLDDLSVQMGVSQRLLEPPNPIPPQESLEAVEAHRNRRNGSYRFLAGLRLLSVLEQPASAFLQDRPRLRYADEVADDDSEVTLLQYIAVAIETGDAAALEAIARGLKVFVQPGPKKEDWATILRSWRYTAAAVREAATEWARGVDVGALSNQDLVQRIVRAGLKIETTLESKRTHLVSARQIVAKEYHVRPSTIGKMWKRRAEVLPAGDQMLAE